MRGQAYKEVEQNRVSEPGGHVRYHLPIVLPNDILLELLRSARVYNVSVEELLLDMIEDYLEDCRKTPRSATLAKEPPEPRSRPKGT